MEKIGFFENKPGNKSSSRLNSSIIIWAALLFVAMLLVFGLMDPETSPFAIAGAAGTLFVTVAGPAMLFMFSQKKQELNNGHAKPYS